MTHRLIVGMTESGKTTLAKIFAWEYKAKNVNTILLDPMADPEWRCDRTYRNPDQFLATAKASTQCGLFIDESGKAMGKFDREMEWVTCMSRHWGHEATLISQRGVQINPTVREQCGEVYIFALGSDKDAEVFARSFGDDTLRGAVRLRKGEFYAAKRFNADGSRTAARKYKIDFPTRTIQAAQTDP